MAFNTPAIERFYLWGTYSGRHKLILHQCCSCFHFVFFPFLFFFSPTLSTRLLHCMRISLWTLFFLLIVGIIQYLAGFGKFIDFGNPIFQFNTISCTGKKEEKIPREKKEWWIILLSVSVSRQNVHPSCSAQCVMPVYIHCTSNNLPISSTIFKRFEECGWKIFFYYYLLLSPCCSFIVPVCSFEMFQNVQKMA